MYNQLYITFNFPSIPNGKFIKSYIKTLYQDGNLFMKLRDVLSNLIFSFSRH